MRTIRSKRLGSITFFPNENVVRRVRERVFNESPWLRRKDVGGELVLDEENSIRGAAIFDEEIRRWEARRPRTLGAVARARIVAAEKLP